MRTKRFFGVNRLLLPAFLVLAAMTSACGHRGGSSSNDDIGNNAGGVSMQGDPRLEGSSGAIGVTTIQSEDESGSYSMIISFGSTPLGTLQADINAYKMSNGLEF